MSTSVYTGLKFPSRASQSGVQRLSERTVELKQWKLSFTNYLTRSLYKLQYYYVVNKQCTNLRWRSNHQEQPPVLKDIYSRINRSQRYCRHATFAARNNCTEHCVVCLCVISRRSRTALRGPHAGSNPQRVIYNEQALSDLVYTYITLTSHMELLATFPQSLEATSCRYHTCCPRN
jgi:hypothetical protein